MSLFRLRSTLAVCPENERRKTNPTPVRIQTLFTAAVVPYRPHEKQHPGEVSQVQRKEVYDTTRAKHDVSYTAAAPPIDSSGTPR